MTCEWTSHASENLKDRAIERGWIETTIEQPDWAEPDPRDPEVIRLFRAVPEGGGKILRVVVACWRTERCRVVTFFFDRNAVRP